jgi:hypothetical protein
MDWPLLHVDKRPRPGRRVKAQLFPGQVSGPRSRSRERVPLARVLGAFGHKRPPHPSRNYKSDGSTWRRLNGLSSGAFVSCLERVRLRSSNSVQRVSKFLSEEQLATTRGVVNHLFVDYVIPLFPQWSKTRFMGHPANQHNRDTSTAEKLLNPDLEPWKR